jgi:para-nitrobenzyl esterase
MGIVVETSAGRLEGVQEEGLQSFRGIPFAKPPVGTLRFAAPEAPEPWSGVRSARDFGPSAPQTEVPLAASFGLQVGEQSEDCLTLNVFTPAADGARRPVMVWIHGGAFTIGAGSQPMYDPRPLARRGDAVLVTTNYRLGALGFLDLAEHAGEELGATANAGILDQVAALAWVRDNIEVFGGDPQSVTIFGESAGGMSVGTLLGMPTARGLFHRAIAQSGAAHRVNRADEAAKVATLWLNELGIGSGSAERLREIPVDAILRAQNRCVATLEWESGGRAFCPGVDGRTLPEHPFDAIRDGLSRHVPVVVGTTRDEWKLFGLMDPRARELDDVGLQARIEARLGGPEAPRRARCLIEAYRKAREGRSSSEPRELFFAIETDRVFRIPALRLAEAQSAHQAQRPRTWAYLVCWESPLLGGSLGACHGIDIPFVFGSIGRRGAQRFSGSGPDAERLSARMMDAWLAFARAGDPNHADLPDWAPYDADRRTTLIFDRKPGVSLAPFDAERSAWDGLL